MVSRHSPNKIPRTATNSSLLVGHLEYNCNLKACLSHSVATSDQSVACATITTRPRPAITHKTRLDHSVARTDHYVVNATSTTRPQPRKTHISEFFETSKGHTAHLHFRNKIYIIVSEGPLSHLTGCRHRGASQIF